MNANMRFDQMYKRAKLQDAKESLACWQKGLEEPNLSEHDREVLTRFVAGAKENIAKWERAVREWWT